MGSIAIQLLIETAKGMINAYASATASKRVDSLIFGAVDYYKDMRVKLTTEATEQLYGRYYTAVAARAAGCVAIDCPFVDFENIPAFEKSVLQGRQMGYEGRMLIHPSQIEPSHRLYMPSADEVEWADGRREDLRERGDRQGRRPPFPTRARWSIRRCTRMPGRSWLPGKEISDMEALRGRSSHCSVRQRRPVRASGPWLIGE